MITFKVPLTAVIKDYRLGLLNYFFFTCIFIYILGYELWWKVGYMFKPELGLAMRVTLREPDEFHYPAYCGKNLSSTCSKHSKGSWKGCNFQGIKRPCRQLHGQAASYQDADRFTVITRKTVVSRLPLESSKHVSQFYVQDIENFTMMLQPTVFTLTSTELHNGTVAGSELKGYLYVGNRGGASNHVQDQLCREKGKGPAPCHIDADLIILGNPIFKVRTLLRAMGLGDGHMDEVDASCPRAKAIKEPIRHSGMIVVVIVDIVSYIAGHGPVTPHYVLRQLPVECSRFSFDSQDVSLQNGQLIKEEQDNHGLQFVFQVGGTIATFSFSHMLLQFTKSIALISVCSVMLKYMAVYLYPLGDAYYHAMYKESPNFDQVETLLEKEDDKLHEHFQETFGTRIVAPKHRAELALRLTKARTADLSDSESSSQPWGDKMRADRSGMKEKQRKTPHHCRTCFWKNCIEHAGNILTFFNRVNVPKAGFHQTCCGKSRDWKCRALRNLLLVRVEASTKKASFPCTEVRLAMSHSASHFYVFAEIMLYNRPSQNEQPFLLCKFGFALTPKVQCGSGN